MELPISFLDSLQHAAGFDRQQFEKVHQVCEQVISVRMNPAKPIEHFRERFAVPWALGGYYLPSRPSFTFDPYFHAGCYYVQEASSMFLEQALIQTADLSQPLRVLDLSAAPGGKSTHIQSRISGNSLLVSNEVIRSRANVLKDNIIKWGSANVIVTNNDPRDFGRLEGFFDIIVVDAPCSGSGLFRKDPEAMEEWSLNNVQLCTQRQQRIIADVLPALKDGGILIYSTCSYSVDEDEDIVEWLRKEMSLTSISLKIENEWGIVECDGGYRFWPDKIKGEGFFMACLRKGEDGSVDNGKLKSKPAKLTGKETDLVKKWIDPDAFDFIKHENTAYAWPSGQLEEFSIILDRLRVVYSGVLLGEMIRDKLIPSHALALSKILSSSIEGIELDHDQAIRYLQRKDMHISSVPGWKKILFGGQSLGWVNVLVNRTNNYYPKELRILKESI